MEQQCIYEDERIEVIRKGNRLVVTYKEPHTVSFNTENKSEIDSEVVRMIKMRTDDGRKYLTQEQIGKIIGVSRQMVNRRWQVY